VELEALQETLGGITAAGATLVALSPQREPFLRQLVKKHGLAFDVLHDARNEVAGRFGLRFELSESLKELYLGFGIDLERINGDDSWTLPIPGRFVIDQNSTIRAADVDPDYSVRPEPSETIEVLMTLTNG
jgi:peroxiredoxin